MSKIILAGGSRRRYITIFAAVFLLAIIVTIYANPGFTESTSRYVEGAVSHVKGWRPGSSTGDNQYLSGAEDPDRLIGDYEKGHGADKGEGEQKSPTTTTTAALKVLTTAPGATKTKHQYSSFTGHPSIDNALADFEDEEEEIPPYYYEDPDIHEIEFKPIAESHYLVESISGKNGKYFEIDFNGRSGLNPNIVPHPYVKGQWLMVAQRDHDDRILSPWSAEMVCDGMWTGEKLQCNGSSTILPITFSVSHNCIGEGKPPILGQLSMNIGPHDARVFMGPNNAAYVMFGSQSDHDDLCFGQWIQDLRLLLEWGPFIDKEMPFAHAVSIHRPPPVRPVEKNYFIFWGPQGEMYAHYDLEPRRSFAAIDPDGLSSPNLAKKTRTIDEPCWQKWIDMTDFANGTHQATNSLSLTMCKRADPSCKATDANTFIMTIFQKKLSYGGHAYYLPFVLLFHSTPPFAFYSITTKPFWMKGQREAGTPLPAHETIGIHGNIDFTYKHPEMIYITSMNWKEKLLDYHGFMDDAIFMAFGREDSWMSAMDVTPEALLGPESQWLMC